MHRQKLIGLLREASLVVAGQPAMSSDLATAAQALEIMPAEKFAAITDPAALAKMFDKENILLEGTTPAPFTQPNTAVSTCSGKQAFTWNIKAASAIRAKLASTIKGASVKLDDSRPDALAAAKLPAEQTPNGDHPGMGTVTGIEDSTGAKLPVEQTPDTAAALSTDMADKSEGPLAKEAAGYQFAGVQMGVQSSLEEYTASADDLSEIGSLFTR
jgi:hypothetical protein